MYSYETKKHTESILDRMDKSQSSLEKLAFEVINYTDEALTGMKEVKKYLSLLDEENTKEEKDKILQSIKESCGKMEESIKKTNGLAHVIEEEVIEQSEVSCNIRQIIDFMYGMQI